MSISVSDTLIGSVFYILKIIHIVMCHIGARVSFVNIVVINWHVMNWHNSLYIFGSGSAPVGIETDSEEIEATEKGVAERASHKTEIQNTEDHPDSATVSTPLRFSRFDMITFFSVEMMNKSNIPYWLMLFHFHGTGHCFHCPFHQRERHQYPLLPPSQALHYFPAKSLGNQTLFGLNLSIFKLLQMKKWQIFS